jgi:hypothetical protein
MLRNVFVSCKSPVYENIKEADSQKIGNVMMKPATSGAKSAGIITTSSLLESRSISSQDTEDQWWGYSICSSHSIALIANGTTTLLIHELPES